MRLFILTLAFVMSLSHSISVFAQEGSDDAGKMGTEMSKGEDGATATSDTSKTTTTTTTETKKEKKNHKKLNKKKKKHTKDSGHE